MAELEKRLAELETAVGSGSDKQGPLSAGVQGGSLMVSLFCTLFFSTELHPYRQSLLIL